MLKVRLTLACALLGVAATACGGSDDGGGNDGTAGTTATGGVASTAGTTGGGSGGTVASPEEVFSFFVTSLEAMQRLSGNPYGFGGDLRYGEADGLTGADKICTEIAEYSMPGAGAKQWRAFLSVTAGPDGDPVNAKDRIGQGPWYDRTGRLVAASLTDLLNERPIGADATIVNDLPNEYGIPNHDPDGTGEVDNHDFLTGTDDTGSLFHTDPGFTCNDWTSATGSTGTPRCGHTWPTTMGGGLGDGTFPGGDGTFPSPPSGDGTFPGGADIGMGSMSNWMSALNEAGCAPGINLVQDGGPDPNNPTVGSGGGYGGIYCFALTP